MALPIEQFFLKRFVAYNEERYRDSHPKFVTKLKLLTLEQVTFSNLRKNTVDGVEIYTVDMSSPGLFTAPNQSFTPGDYVFNNASTLVMDRVLDRIQLEHRFIPGIYKLSDGEVATLGAVLLPIDGRTEASVKQQIKDSCNYILQDSEITVSQDLTSAAIASMTITGTLAVVESVNDDGSAYYDGFYKHDGTITY